jgi:hypothetical protein
MQVSSGAVVVLEAAPTCVLVAMVQELLHAQHWSAWIDRASLQLLPAAAINLVHTAQRQADDISFTDILSANLSCGYAVAFGALLENAHLLPQPHRDVVQLLGRWTHSFFQAGDSDAEMCILSWMGKLLCRRN